MIFVLGLILGACAGCFGTAICVAAGRARDVLELTEEVKKCAANARAEGAG